MATGNIWAMKQGDRIGSPFAGTVSGLQFASDYISTAPGGRMVICPGDIACGSTTVTLLGSNSSTVIIEGSGERATSLTYTGTGRFIVVGQDDGDHSGTADSYNGAGPSLRLKDLKLAGPGQASTATGLTDWENGYARYENVFFDQWLHGYFGIGADVVTFDTCLFNRCGKGAFLASRADQTTFSSCSFQACDIQANIEYAYGSRFLGCTFVFPIVADIVFDAPASPTQGGDERLEVASTIVGCWFESGTTPQVPRHIWVGSNGTSTRRIEGVTVYGGNLLAANTLNFMDVEAATQVSIDRLYQSGTISNKLVNIVTVSGLSQVVNIGDNRTNPSAAYLGGTTGATQQVVKRTRTTNSSAFAASFDTNADSGEVVEIGALTNNITINAPSNALRGRRLTYLITQDGTGGRTVTWNSVFKQAWSDTGNTASKRSSIQFYYNGTNWNQVGAQSPYI